MRKDKLSELKNELQQASVKLIKYEDMFETATTLHDRDCAFILKRCYKNRVESLKESIEFELMLKTI